MTKRFALRAHRRQDVCAPSETWRVFCAVEIPTSVHQSVLRHVARLRETVSDAKASWAHDNSLHLTLKFLGEIPQVSVPTFSEAASLAVAGFAPFSIRLEQTGYFPKRGRPRVLWIGVSDVSGKLGELHARLEKESSKAGFPKEDRAFHPHLTIARLRHARDASKLAEAHLQIKFEPVEVPVKELLVIRSELRSEGSKYTVVSRHPLFGVQ